MSKDRLSEPIACPVEEIAAYIDGELDAACEAKLSLHFGTCGECSYELNQQKLFLRGLDIGLQNDDEVQLPADFARSIIANAESSVSGLRRPSERFNALFICTGLMLFVLFGLGAEAGKIIEGTASVIEQIAIVGAFFGHLLYAFFLGIAIILRALMSQLSMEGIAAGTLAIVAVVMSLLVSQKLLLTKRA